MPMRLATMPLGVMKDLAKGGVVGMGKNFVPRMNNVIKGDTLFNHAQAIKRKPKITEVPSANNTEEHKG